MERASKATRKPRGQGNGYHGMNWVRKEKRLALYLRDGFACAWCGAGVEDGVVLTLDHLHPYAHGGSNEAANLVTACSKCNSARGDRAVGVFAEAVAGYLNKGLRAVDVVAHVAECAGRDYSVKDAKALLALRGSWAAATKGSPA